MLRTETPMALGRHHPQSFEKRTSGIRSVGKVNRQNTPRYQRIKCHQIIDVKMGENFHRYARFVAGSHTNEVPDSLITMYLSEVLRDSVRIALMITALDGLKFMACDIQNAYLTADGREKIWTLISEKRRYGRPVGRNSVPRLAPSSLSRMHDTDTSLSVPHSIHCWQTRR